MFWLKCLQTDIVDITNFLEGPKHFWKMPQVTIALQLWFSLRSGNSVKCHLQEICDSNHFELRFWFLRIEFLHLLMNTKPSNCNISSDFKNTDSQVRILQFKSCSDLDEARDLKVWCNINIFNVKVKALSEGVESHRRQINDKDDRACNRNQHSKIQFEVSAPILFRTYLSRLKYYLY